MASYDYLLIIAFLLTYIIFLGNAHSEKPIHFTTNAKESLLCRICGADVAYSNDITNQLSPKALVSRNNTLFGRSEIDIQVLQNPLGIQFQLITSSNAYCIVSTPKWHTEFSWFPGYAWKTCSCRHCGTHIGWMFEPLHSAIDDKQVPSDKGFYALIVDKILGEVFADSLIVTPKFDKL